MQDTIDDFLFYLKDIEYLKPGLNTKYAGFVRMEFTRAICLFKSITYANLCMVQRKGADIKVLA